MKNPLEIKTGIAGTVLTIIVANITSFELLKAALMAAVGTTVSFGISFLLQKIIRHRSRKSSGRK